jgi:hypothetical protein
MKIGKGEGKRAHPHGETETLVVRVRNVGKKEVKFHYVPEFFNHSHCPQAGGHMAIESGHRTGRPRLPFHAWRNGDSG